MGLAIDPGLGCTPQRSASCFVASLALRFCDVSIRSIRACAPVSSSIGGSVELVSLVALGASQVGCCQADSPIVRLGDFSFGVSLRSLPFCEGAAPETSFSQPMLHDVSLVDVQKSGHSNQGKGGSGEGRSKPNLETNTHMNPHSDTVKQVPMPHRQHTTQHNTQHNKLVLAKVGFGQSRFWPKSVLAKVGLAKVDFGQSRFGQSRFWPKSAIPLKH